MRDERNSLDEHFKYKLALSASRTNGCNYCTAHHAKTLARRWGYEDSEIESVLSETDAADEREQVALEFVNVASADPKGVPDELRQKMASFFTPPEVMEIVLTFGFWKMYNAMHDAMALPIEDPVLGLDAWTQEQSTRGARGPLPPPHPTPDNTGTRPSPTQTRQTKGCG